MGTVVVKAHIGDGKTVRHESTTGIFLERLCCSKRDGRYTVSMDAVELEMPEDIAIDFLESLCSMLSASQAREFMALLERMHF